jgi:uncharacterized protein YbjT (DUF2867 family)
MSKTILVIGGTGMLGAPVARRLQADGFQVRVLARDTAKAAQLFDSSFEIVAGDVADRGSLEQAMRGCDGVHISVGGPVDQLSAENVAALAPRAGITHITYISGSTVCEQNGWFPMVQQKLMAEKAIRECGVPYTIFCPTWPMEQLPRFIAPAKVVTIGKQPTPLHWFAADDLARMISAAYQTEAAQNKRLYVHGPEALPMKAALERACAVLKPEVTSVGMMPVWMARAIGTLTGNGMLKFAAGLMGYFDKAGELGEPAEANQLLGAPTTTLDQWLADKQTARS